MKNPLRREPQSFAGKRALVTGGASGLGLAMTKILAVEGAKVLVVDVHELAPEGVLPAGVEYRQLDVRSDEGWDATRNWVEATWGGLDLLFNNAGVAAGGRIDVESIENWQWIIDINLLGVVRGCRTFVPMMKQAGGGHIVNTASLAGLVHAPSMASYNAVKAAVVAVSETLRHELAPDRIDVSVICPSFFRTNLAESLQGKDVDMEETAVRLITQAPRSADEVASKALEGVRNRRFIVLTDSDGVAAYNAKRYARKAYDAAMIRSAKQVREGKDPMADIDKVWSRMRKSKS
ncbi:MULTISPECIES: SDR family NAD(P)-dependent oxidoreductase [unclassified Yimella]|uniref:SDR family NAD(P)-dependent oxidoreductase n=1 Tax=unclassified Yimella TaxID=2649892 RepID=UPI00101DC424|nr:MULTISPECIES: SDR family NAD(P)-dependent oxidoreductase [unclassified Yimella]MCG8654165.1 SDR family NAD(P)-dependent oxidoreductase [Yimella sp. NH-Cas1]RYG77323.1 SDR family NAD(P)-dependent oxidoreductase [Yimella sp. RIT 621]